MKRTIFVVGLILGLLILFAGRSESFEPEKFLLGVQDFCGRGSLKIIIRSLVEPTLVDGCQGPFGDFIKRVKLPAGIQPSVILQGFVGGYLNPHGNDEHRNELLNLCLIPPELKVILRLDSAPDATLPLVDLKSERPAEYFYSAYATAVIDYLRKTPCAQRIELVIVGNEVHFWLQQPPYKVPPGNLDERWNLANLIRDGAFGPEVEYHDEWGFPKIVQVITPKRYAGFFKAIAQAIEHSEFSQIKLLPAALFLDPRLYRDYLNALREAGVRNFIWAIPLHAYTNSLGFNIPTCREPWCLNSDLEIQGEFVYFMEQVLLELDQNFPAKPILITELNPWIGWKGHGYSAEARAGYIALILQSIVKLNRKHPRHPIVGLFFYSWNTDHNDYREPQNPIVFGLSEVPEVLSDGLNRFFQEQKNHLLVESPPVSIQTKNEAGETSRISTWWRRLRNLIE